MERIPESGAGKENSLPKTVEDLLVQLKSDGRYRYLPEKLVTPEVIEDVGRKFGLVDGMSVFDVRVTGDEEGRSSMDFYTCAGPHDAVMAFAAHERRGPGRVKDTIHAYEKRLGLVDQVREWVLTLARMEETIKEYQNYLDADKYPRVENTTSRFTYKPETIEHGKSSDLHILRTRTEDFDTLAKIGPVLKVESSGSQLCPHCHKMLSTPNLSSEDEYGRLF